MSNPDPNLTNHYFAFYEPIMIKVVNFSDNDVAFFSRVIDTVSSCSRGGIKVVVVFPVSSLKLLLAINYYMFID